jgi:acyl carrier protein
MKNGAQLTCCGPFDCLLCAPIAQGLPMSCYAELTALLDRSLQLNGRGLLFTPKTRLLGALPELDSIAVLQVLSALEQQFSVRIADDEISAELFYDVASLHAFIKQKMGL